MNRNSKTFLALGFGLMLAGCATEHTYTKTPYDSRTAGKGEVVYYNMAKEEPAIVTVTEVEPAAGEPAPVIEPQKTFREKMRK